MLNPGKVDARWHGTKRQVNGFAQERPGADHDRHTDNQADQGIEPQPRRVYDQDAGATLASPMNSNAVPPLIKTSIAATSRPTRRRHSENAAKPMPFADGSLASAGLVGVRQENLWVGPIDADVHGCDQHSNAFSGLLFIAAAEIGTLPAKLADGRASFQGRSSLITVIGLRLGTARLRLSCPVALPIEPAGEPWSRNPVHSWSPV